MAAGQPAAGCFNRRVQNRTAFGAAFLALPVLSAGIGALAGDLAGGGTGAFALVMLELFACYAKAPGDEDLEAWRRYLFGNPVAVMPSQAPETMGGRLAADHSSRSPYSAEGKHSTIEVSEGSGSAIADGAAAAAPRLPDRAATPEEMDVEERGVVTDGSAMSGISVVPFGSSVLYPSAATAGDAHYDGDSDTVHSFKG